MIYVHNDIYGVSIIFDNGELRQKRCKKYIESHDDTVRGLCKDEYNLIDEFTNYEMLSNPCVSFWPKAAALTKSFNTITILENFYGRAFIVFIPQSVNQIQLNILKKLYDNQKYNDYVFGDRTYDDGFVIKLSDNRNLDDIICLLESKLSEKRKIIKY